MRAIVSDWGFNRQKGQGERKEVGHSAPLRGDHGKETGSSQVPLPFFPSEITDSPRLRIRIHQEEHFFSPQQYVKREVLSSTVEEWVLLVGVGGCFFCFALCLRQDLTVES